MISFSAFNRLAITLCLIASGVSVLSLSFLHKQALCTFKSHPSFHLVGEPALSPRPQHPTKARLKFSLTSSIPISVMLRLAKHTQPKTKKRCGDNTDRRQEFKLIKINCRRVRGETLRRINVVCFEHLSFSERKRIFFNNTPDKFVRN